MNNMQKNELHFYILALTYPKLKLSAYEWTPGLFLVSGRDLGSRWHGLALEYTTTSPTHSDMKWQDFMEHGDRDPSVTLVPGCKAQICLYDPSYSLGKTARSHRTDWEHSIRLAKPGIEHTLTVPFSRQVPTDSASSVLVEFQGPSWVIVYFNKHHPWLGVASSTESTSAADRTEPQPGELWSCP